ncbi:hypothetical protein, partial [Pseudomonas syringae group genomosp. 7]
VKQKKKIELLGTTIIMKQNDNRGKGGKLSNTHTGQKPGEGKKSKETALAVHGMKIVSMTALADALEGSSLASAVTW